MENNYFKLAKLRIGHDYKLLSCFVLIKVNRCKTTKNSSVTHAISDTKRCIAYSDEHMQHQNWKILNNTNMHSVIWKFTKSFTNANLLGTRKHILFGKVKLGGDFTRIACRVLVRHPARTLPPHHNSKNPCTKIHGYQQI